VVLNATQLASQAGCKPSPEAKRSAGFSVGELTQGSRCAPPAIRCSTSTPKGVTPVRAVCLTVERLNPMLRKTGDPGDAARIASIRDWQHDAVPRCPGAYRSARPASNVKLLWRRTLAQPARSSPTVLNGPATGRAWRAPSCKFYHRAGTSMRCCPETLASQCKTSTGLLAASGFEVARATGRYAYLWGGEFGRRSPIRRAS